MDAFQLPVVDAALGGALDDAEREKLRSIYQHVKQLPDILTLEQGQGFAIIEQTYGYQGKAECMECFSKSLHLRQSADEMIFSLPLEAPSADVAYLMESSLKEKYQQLQHLQNNLLGGYFPYAIAPLPNARQTLVMHRLRHFYLVEYALRQRN